MGGGDLNTKKSWHPNTMKNQERVWKAEQAAAEEKKKILELQRERDMEHDRAQLNNLAQRNFGAEGGGDNRLSWMYDKPNKQAQQEDYLLGKAIGKNEESDSQQNAIPAVNRRVVGSSMLTSGDDTQVDLARKLREDPLLLVKERERAARAALLNNPLQRKRIAELLRKEQENKEKSTKKKVKTKDKHLDKLLADKLTALGADKGINLASLLNSDDSSSDSSSEEQSKKKKKKKDKKKKKKKKTKDSDSSNDEKRHRNKTSSKKKSTKYKDKSRHDNDFDIPSLKQLDHKNNKKAEKESRKRRSKSNERHDHSSKKRRKSESETDSDRPDEGLKRHKDKDRRGTDMYQRSKGNAREVLDKRQEGKEKRKGLSDEERAARLAEMALAGAEHEAERGRRVQRYRAEDARADAAAPRASVAFRNEARAIPHSLESRIHSNRHYIQRDKSHMDKHFARR